MFNEYSNYIQYYKTLTYVNIFCGNIGSLSCLDKGNLQVCTSLVLCLKNSLNYFCKKG